MNIPLHIKCLICGTQRIQKVHSNNRWADSTCVGTPILIPINAGADTTDPQTWNGYAYVKNNSLALVDPMGMCTVDAEGNAVEDENRACSEVGFGGSVTVTAPALPEIPLIWISFTSGSAADLSHPPPHHLPSSPQSSRVSVQAAKNKTPGQPNKQLSCLIEAAKDKGLSIAIDAIKNHSGCWQCGFSGCWNHSCQNCSESRDWFLFLSDFIGRSPQHGCRHRKSYGARGGGYGEQHSGHSSCDGNRRRSTGEHRFLCRPPRFASGQANGEL